MIHGRAPSIPAPVLAAFTFALAVAVWRYFVAFHEMSRALVGGFDSPPRDVTLAVVGTAIGALPLLAVLPLALLPRWWFGRGRPERRLAAGRCPDCDYPCTHFPCPECGGDGRIAPLDLFSRAPLRNVLLLAAGLGVGAIMEAEWRVRRDEASFRTEVDAALARGEDRPLARPRAGWGSIAQLHWDLAQGFTAPPPFEYPRIPGWRANGKQASDTGN